MKTARLTKLKSALKKLPSFSNRTSPRTTTASVSGDLYPVYVGQSRRRYLVPAEVISHPLFQVLVDKSDGSDGATVVVACEVVMFDHLLWMLQNSADSQLGSMEELVEYYTNC